MMRNRLAVLIAAFGALAGCSAVDEMTSSDAVRAPGFQPGYEVAAKPNDTVESIARRFNITGSALVKANHLHPPYTIQPHQLLIIPPPATYTVRDGDTVAGISASLGVDETALAQANGLGRPYHMRIGQQLTVPGGYGGDGAPPEKHEMAEYTAPVVVPRASISAQPLAPPPAMARPGGAQPPPPVPPQSAAPPPLSASGVQAQSLAPPPANPQVTLAPPAISAPPLPQPRQTVATAQPTAIVPLAAPPVPSRTQPAPPTPVQPSANSAVGHQAGLGTPHFIRPVAGSVAQGFGPDGSGQTNDGINIAAPAGTVVKAADAGTVIYTGNELAAFGNLILIRHAGGWVTAYGHLASIGVTRGTNVSQGQAIGTVGQTGTVGAPQLHFEIRQGSKPVDPAPLLGGGKG
jgi:murein DD-endopeptidase MepM/ murein hydrolase activator NlpD